MELLTVRNVSKSFLIERGVFRARTGVLAALNDVSFSLRPGSVLGVVGESGSGKTTLGRIVCGLLAPDSGTVTIEGRPLREYARKELAAKVQMIFQDPFASLNPRLSIGTMLFEAAAYLHGEQREGRVREILDTVALPYEILSSYPHRFSGGQRQRIAIARSLLRQPKIIVADEPLSSLDLSIQNQLLGLFLRLKRSHALSFVFISHDLVVTSNLADYILVMKNGTIVEEGPAEKVIECPENEYTKKLLAAVPLMERR